MYHLFLDDERLPQNVTWVSLPFGKTDDPDSDWIVVRSFKEFVNCIENTGCPHFISFDHDLGDMGPNEKNGLSCAKWLVEYCLDNNTPCPNFEVHSKNPQGANNIRGLLKGFQEFQKSSTNHKVKI